MTSNPALYRRMCEPRPDAEAGAAVTAFFEDVRIAREKHGIADAHILAAVSVADGAGGEYASQAVYHLGDSLKALPMVAYEFGRLQGTHDEMIKGLLAQPKRRRAIPSQESQP